MRELIAIGAAVLLAGTAAGETIDGCVHQKSGKLRVVAIPGQCKSNEAAISWESEGPPGPAGSAGQDGAQGPQGEAGVSPRYELVGFTTATFKGGDGVLEYTSACHAEFSNSRMCTSKEVLETVNVPTLSGEAWVRPVFVVLPRGTTNSVIADVSGAFTPSSGSTGSMSCDAWRRLTAESGLMVESNGAFDLRNCNDFRSIACCAPPS